MRWRIGLPEVFSANAQCILLTFIAVTMPWSTKFCNIGIILLIAFWVLFIEKKIELKHETFIPLVFLIYIIILLLSLLHFYSNGLAIRMFETRIPFLFFPLYFFIRKEMIPSSHVSVVLLSFTLSVLVLTFCLFQNGFNFLYSDNRIWAIQDLMILHRPYFGVYVSISVILIFTLISRHDVSYKIKGIGVLIAGYLVFILYAIVAKNAFIGIILAGILCFLVFLWKTRKRYFSFFVFVLLLFGSSQYFFNRSVNSFISNIFSFTYISYETYHTNLIDSFNRRFEIWGCTIAVLKEDNKWLTGVGLGNEQKYIDECYLERGYIHMGEDNFNAHNQILQDTLTSGLIFGVISFLILLMPSFFAISKLNYELLAVVAIIFCFTLTESVFLRQKGVVVYSFFVCLLTHIRKAPIEGAYKNIVK